MAEPSGQAGMAFEEAMEQLEAIVDAMESDKMPLDDLVKSYETGTRLLKICQSRISAAHQRIELIAKESGGAGEFSLSAFDEDPAAGAGTGTAGVPAGESGPETVAPAKSQAQEYESDEIQLL